MAWMKTAAAALEIVKNLIEGLQSVVQLHRLSSQHGILSLHARSALRDEVQHGQRMAALLPQLAHLRHQIVQLPLLAHPRSPRRFAVRYHPLLFLLLQQSL